ncbi:D-inositol 3-phosphate glycosyltransferase [Salinivirga cyanobacteriivorans]|uniref:D-inositol 3-phosphate glycosyltransferase n=1 Tax=Salinivirga cyanobacteriivorans TaxID=1307839 RepID=A0A0S2HYN5_9BACT|nr:glycosyltransferase [Salinivirga cyanobacteriivorans]ALO15090.1 D-inositol 3-phosphate glycosyltransferase [Salinivirga cyanobacteriivorans]
MPKVLRIINRFNLGGPTYNAAYLTRYLTEKGFETKLVGGASQDSEADSMFILNQLGIEAEIIPEMHRSLNLINDRKAYIKIKEIIKSYKPDIVHTHASKAGTLGRLAAISQAVPVIVHTFHGHVFHSYFSGAKTSVFKKIEQYLANKSSKIIAISNKQKQELSKEFNIAPPDKFEVIPLGFDLSRFRQDHSEKRITFRKRWNLKEDDFAISIVGRLVPVKNHKLFIESIARLKSKCKKRLKAIIVGDGELREALLKHCEFAGLKTNCNGKPEKDTDIIFTSWLRDVDEVYAGSELAALTSFNEGTPVSLIEALAAGKPVVSTKVGGIEDVVNHKKNGILVPSDNVNAFTKAMQSLVSDDNLRNEMAIEAKKSINGQFSYNRLVDDTSRLYNELLSHSS